MGVAIDLSGKVALVTGAASGKSRMLLTCASAVSFGRPTISPVSVRPPNGTIARMPTAARAASDGGTAYVNVWSTGNGRISSA